MHLKDYRIEVWHIKPLLLICTVACLLFSLSACGDASSATSKDSSKPASQSTSAPAVPALDPLDYNPLTGDPLAEGVEKGWRPLAIMINNASIAYPQRGLSSAEALFEMVTEGGITRIMALYSDYRTIPSVGPVRSARDQHVQFAMPINAIVTHIGSSTYAFNLLNAYSYQDIDGLYLGDVAFNFDTERNKTYDTEHCWYTNAGLIAAGIEKQQIPTTGGSNPLFNFSKNAVVTPNEGEAPDVLFNYSTANTVQFTYHADTGLYTKMAYGAPHMDENTGLQLAFKNVVILVTKIGLKNDNYNADFNLTEGTGYYITNGKYQTINWKKGKPEEPLKLFDTKGNEISVNTGKSYIGVLGTDQTETLRLNAAEPVVAPSSLAP